MFFFNIKIKKTINKSLKLQEGGDNNKNLFLFIKYL